MAHQLRAGSAVGALARGGRVLTATEAHAKLRKGMQLQQKGKLKQARKLYEHALKLEPGNAEALHLLALLAFQTNRPQQAVDLIGRAIEADPTNATAHNNLAVAFHRLGRFEEALDSCSRATTLKPHYADAHNTRGKILKELNRTGEALESLDRAVVLRPEHAEAIFNRASLLHEMGRFADALADYERVTALMPNFAPAHDGRAFMLQMLTRFDEAVESYERALALRPDYAECHWNLCSMLLSTGDFTRGWKESAWRPSRRDTDRMGRHRLHADILCTGLDGRHVVVVGEQGLGDELFFLRFVPALRKRGARVTYHGDGRLVAMLNRAGIADEVLSSAEPIGNFDLLIMVGDLPRLLEAGSVAPPLPYSIPPLERHLIDLRRLLAEFGPPPYLGLTWRAGTDGQGLLYKEMSLKRLAGAVRSLDATPVVVQRLPRDGEVATLERIFGKPVLDLSALNDDLEQMLALMDLLDIYVCVSNTNVYLRTANGRTCHVLAPSGTDFRWMAEGEKSPWFPESRIYRQASAPRYWRPALDALRRDLAGG